jgi:hypothetical protein
MAAISAIARFFVELGVTQPPVGANVWKGSAIILDEDLALGEYRDVFTKRKLRATKHGGMWLLPLSEVFSDLTVGLLERLL